MGEDSLDAGGHLNLLQEPPPWRSGAERCVARLESRCRVESGCELRFWRVKIATYSNGACQNRNLWPRGSRNPRNPPTLTNVLIVYCTHQHARKKPDVPKSQLTLREGQNRNLGESKSQLTAQRLQGARGKIATYRFPPNHKLRFWHATRGKIATYSPETPRLLGSWALGLLGSSL